MSETIKHKIAVLLAKYFIRMDRGQGLQTRLMAPLTDFVTGGMILVILKDLWGITIDPEYLKYIVIGLIIFKYNGGYFDEKIGFWKVENEYASKNLNPFNQQILKLLEDNIKKQEEILTLIKEKVNNEHQ